MDKLIIYLGLHGDGPVSNISTAVPGQYIGLFNTGPAGFLSYLETHLGLDAAFPAEQQRIMNLKAALDQVSANDDFLYKEAFTKDPLGVARRLLNLWDTWRLSGWDTADDDELPRRMKMVLKLRATFEQAGPGVVERTTAILQAVEQNATLPPLEIRLVDEQSAFTPLLQDLLCKLRNRSNLEVKEIAFVPQADVSSDLGKLQCLLNSNDGKHTGSIFTGDGSLQILHFKSGMEAAEALHTVQRKTSWQPLVVSRDVSYVNGINIRTSHPLFDWKLMGGNGQVLQLFFLATALFKRPVNTMQVLAFLSAPLTPFSKRLAWQLLTAFSETPGFASDKWQGAIDKYIQELDGSRKMEKKRRVDFWLNSKLQLSEGKYETSKVSCIFEELQAWALSVAAMESLGDSMRQQLRQLSSLCKVLIEALQQEGDTISEAKFERLQIQLFNESAFTLADAQVGSSESLPEPGSLWYPAGDTLWLDAIRREVSDCLAKYWYREEVIYFQSRGYTVQDNLHAYTNWKAGIRRLVLNTRNRLVVVVPRNWQGETAYKPFCIDEWSEAIDVKPITIKVDDLLKSCPWQKSQSLVKEYKAIALPKPSVYIKVPEQNYTRKEGYESYTSLEKLFQHPVQWYFEYCLELKHRSGLSTPDFNSIKGRLADEVVQRVFSKENQQTSWWKDEIAFKKEVLTAFQVALQVVGLPLLEKKNKRARVEYELNLLKNLAVLKRMIDENHYSIVGTQQKCPGTFVNVEFRGDIDLLLEKNGSQFILDLKWANSPKTYYERLEKGYDLQLVLYKEIRQANSAAYFLLNNGELIIRNEPGWTIPEGSYVRTFTSETITIEGTFQKAKNSYLFRMDELKNGKAEAAYHDKLSELKTTYSSNESLYPLQTNKEEFKKAPYVQDYSLILGSFR